MRDAFLLSACRTPVGKFRGGLSSLSAVELAAQAIASAVHRARVQSRGVDEVILGCVLTAGLGQAPARQAALRAGLDVETAAVTINKVCGSGLKSVMLASQAVRCGDAELIVAGGMESMSRAAYVLPRDSSALGDRTLIDSLKLDGLTCAHSGRSMGDIAEELAQSAGLTREQLDRYALESHRRAAQAISEGRFQAELVPVPVEVDGETRHFNQDEGPRPGSSLDQLATLPPAFRKNGLITAGNASMLSDGAAVVVVGSEAAARRHGVKPLARVVSTITVGAEPEKLFTAPVEAIREVTARAHLSLADIDLLELNEAFAAQMLACLRELEIDPERVNIHGGAIALGHPIGASGARVLVTLLHALEARGKQIGVAALCLGGGNAVAMLVERC